MSFENYTIRRAEKKDAKAIHEVLLAAFEEYRFYYSPEGFSDTVLSEKTAKTRIKEMNVYVAVDQRGKIIATIGWQKISKEEGHIRGMGIIPMWQGKNGPAKLLLSQVEEEAIIKGCKMLTLDTTKVLERAQSFYIKNGFKETGKTGNFFGSVIYEFAKTL